MRELSKKVIGITGNIATGKSSVSDYLVNKGYHVVDTDKINQIIFDTDDDYKEKLILLFGNEILNKGKIDKKLLSKVVFNDKKKLEQLNSVSHPLIKRIVDQDIAKNKGIIFVDAPLLFESNFDYIADEIIVVATREDLQLERLLKRNKYSKEEALKRINSQMKLDDKIKRADYVINNNGSLSKLYQQVDKILVAIEKEVK